MFWQPKVLSSLLLIVQCVVAAGSWRNDELQQDQYHRRISLQMGDKVRQLTDSIVALLDMEHARAWPTLLKGTNFTQLSQMMASRVFQPSIGVSVDPMGQAAPNGSMVFMWTPNGTDWPTVFTNASALLAGPPLELGDLVQVEDDGQEMDDFPAEGNRDRRVKREPRRGGGGGGGGGGRGGSGGGRGSSAARSASVAGRTSFSGSSTGIGGIRPHIWIFARFMASLVLGKIFSHGTGHYHWMDDSGYNWEEDRDSDVVRMEISLCFGRHKSRESCSAKVDALLEKMASDRRASAEFKNKVFNIACFIAVMLLLAGWQWSWLSRSKTR